MVPLRVAVRVGAVIATLHDIVLTIGFFALLQLQFDMTAMRPSHHHRLQSERYVVVYDRIRELLRKYKKLPLDELLDLSINRHCRGPSSHSEHHVPGIAGPVDFRGCRDRDLRLLDAVRGGDRNIFVDLHRRTDPDLSRSQAGDGRAMSTDKDATKPPRPDGLAP